jgi:hypothetical protein
MIVGISRVCGAVYLARTTLKYQTCDSKHVVSHHDSGANGLDILSKPRETLGDEISGSAGQCLGFYNVLKTVLGMQRITDQEVNSAIDCYNSLCHVLDLCRRAAVRGKVTPLELHRAITAHLTKFKAVYGAKFWVPKFHLSLHLPTMLKQFYVLLACFVQERKHKEPKRFGGPSRNVAKDLLNTHWEKGIIENVLRVQLHSLHDGDHLPNTSISASAWKPVTSAIQSACAACGIFGDVWMAINVVIRGCVHVHRLDIVSLQCNGAHFTGEVWYHLKIGQSFVSCINVMQHLQDNTFLMRDAPVIVDTECILHTWTYSRVNDTVLVVPP